MVDIPHRRRHNADLHLFDVHPRSKEKNQCIGEKLGISVYDNELLAKIAEESGFAKEYISEKSEHTSGQSRSSEGIYLR